MRVGIDAQSVSEVRAAVTAHGDRYRRRIYTDAEVGDCGGWGAESDASVASLAGRFAAKEAVIKALRIVDPVPAWTDIEVVTAPGGWPGIRLRGVAAELAARQDLRDWEVSISHTGDVAVAVVIAS
jgi:holo-[acyl-carrier protein] synthase